jgi:hypothetical protein
MVAAAADRHGLGIVKSLGDGLLLKATASTPEEAGDLGARFAADTLTDTARSELVDQPYVESRIGATFGRVVTLLDGDILGPVVDLASRLESAAKPGQAVLLAKMFRRTPATGAGYMTSRTSHIALRGVDGPVGVVGVAPSSARFQGIDVKERWSDYDYTVTLHPMEQRRATQRSRGLFQVIHLSYRGVLRSHTFDFVAMEAGEPFSRALRDPKIFSSFYFAPSLFRTSSDAARYFRIEKLLVNSQEVIEQNEKPPTPSGMFIRRRFRLPARGAPPIGARCDFSYIVRSVLPRASSFFSIAEQEIEQPTYSLHISGIETEWLRFAPFL